MKNFLGAFACFLVLAAGAFAYSRFLDRPTLAQRMIQYMNAEAASRPVPTTSAGALGEIDWNHVEDMALRCPAYRIATCTVNDGIARLMVESRNAGREADDSPAQP